MQAMTLLLVASLAACHHDKPPRSITEVPARAPEPDDPAVSSVWPTTEQFPDSASPENERDFPAYSAITDDRFELAPGAARDVPVTTTGTSLVVAQAVAPGAGPLELAIQKDGAVAAAAKALALPDRNEATVAAELDGAVTIHVANRATASMQVRLVVEVAPRGGH